MDTYSESHSSAGWTQWQAAAGVLALVLAGVLLVFWDTAASMESTWRRSDSFQHGYLILPIVLYLIWDKWPKVRVLLPEPTFWTLPIVVMAGGVWLLGNVAHVQIVQQLALVAIVQALVIAVLGWKVARALIFPLAYLYFLVPAGEFLVPVLQDLTANFVVRAVELLDFRVYSDGLMIYVAAEDDLYQFVVAKECSGIRYQIAMLAIGLLVAFLFFRSWSRRILCLIAALAIPIVANWLRATGVVLLVVYSQGRHGTDIDHIIYGFWFFAFLMVIFILACRTFAEDVDGGEASFGTAPPRATTRFVQSALMFSLLGLGIAAAAPLYAGYSASSGTTASSLSLVEPEAGTDWRRDVIAEDWQPRYIGADQEYLGHFSEGGNAVDLYAGIYRSQDEGAELINARNTFESHDWQRAGETGRIKLASGGRSIDSAYVRLIRGAEKKLVLYWYYVDGKTTADPRVAKAYAAASRLLNRNHGAAVFAVGTDYAGDIDGALALLREFAEAVPPMTMLQGQSDK